MNFIRVSAKIVIKNSSCSSEWGDAESWWTFFVHRSAHIRDVHSALASRLFFSRDVGIHSDIDSMILIGHNNDMFTRASTVKLMSFCDKVSKSNKQKFARSVCPGKNIDTALYEAEFMILNSLSEVRNFDVISLSNKSNDQNRFAKRLEALGYSGVR